MSGKPKYSEVKTPKQIMITNDAKQIYRAYAQYIGTNSNDLIEQMARNPDVLRGLADFVEILWKMKNISQNHLTTLFSNDIIDI
jgi:hypothetical protein